MWAFFDFGLLMPALVPAKHKNDASVLEWTNNGEYDLQVRARLSEHLEYFMDNFMEEGKFNPTIQATPDKDYNFRFYTSREAYAEGIKQAALAIDYEKFKDSSDRYAWNKKYHTLLTRIWGTLCELATPGGIWGPKSEDNPHGFDNAWRWGTTRGTGDDYANWHEESYWGDTRRVGDTFRYAGENFEGEEQEFLGYDYRAETIIAEMDELSIPMSEWAENLLPTEFEAVLPEIRKVLGKKTAKQLRKQNKEIWNQHSLV